MNTWAMIRHPFRSHIWTENWPVNDLLMCGRPQCRGLTWRKR